MERLLDEIQGFASILSRQLASGERPVITFVPDRVGIAPGADNKG